MQNKMLTGSAYLESINDGREVWFDGERIKNVAEHPAYRNAARSTARIYDALHDPEYKENLILTDKLGITTHKFFAPSYSGIELLQARDAIAIWQRLNYGDRTTRPRLWRNSRRAMISTSHFMRMHSTGIKNMQAAACT